MSNLDKIKGLGVKTKEHLSALDIKTIEDLVSYYPYRYNFIKLDNLSESKDGDNVIIECIIDSIPIIRRFNSKMNSLTFRVGTNKKVTTIVIFNRAFLKNNLKLGMTITVFGKYNEIKNTVIATDIKLEKIENNTIESIYHLTSGLSNKNLRKYISSALNMITDIKDYIPEDLNEKYDFIDKFSAVKKVHNPLTLKDIKASKLKLIYEELFMFMFKINYLKIINKNTKTGLKRNVDIEKVNDFIRELPFELTKDQALAVKDIYNDLISGDKMNRMLSGDVGSGKTVVGVIASYINYLGGYQTALMAPTEILAIQHYNTIKNLLINTDLKIELLLGSTKKSEKEEIYEKLNTGKIDLVIGTHALISENVEFKKLGLVITDEQHRFGVNQRSNLKNKGSVVDVLYMSATPIPRTYALTLYGDMDISYIKTKPVGRKEIETIIKSEKDLNDVLTLMLEEIKKGHQIYVVSPLIEESETLDLTTVNELKKNIDIAFNKKIKTEILHGKLSKQDKEKVMNEFEQGSINVLISTTVIEVGVDVKNATMMVIFDAERFGLATLHQLRGRIGRNEYESKCILIGSKNNKRLKVLSESNDGFYITEKDFEMRGEGDLFGVKQSGDMTFKIANLKEDYKILLQTKVDSEEFIKENIESNFEKYPNYKKIINSISNLD